MPGLNGGYTPSSSVNGALTLYTYATEGDNISAAVRGNSQVQLAFGFINGSGLLQSVSFQTPYTLKLTLRIMHED